MRLLFKDLKLGVTMTGQQAPTYKIITINGLMTSPAKHLANNKTLYKIFVKYQKGIWSAAQEFAEDTISLPGDEYDHSQKNFLGKSVRKRANVLHFVASFNQADKIKSLADIGSMLACWAIEETCYRVNEDKEENEDQPESAEFADLWGETSDTEKDKFDPGQSHAQYDYNESVQGKPLTYEEWCKLKPGKKVIHTSHHMGMTKTYSIIGIAVSNGAVRYLATSSQHDRRCSIIYDSGSDWKWYAVPPPEMEDMHTQYDYNESAFLEKLNARLGA